MTSRRPQSPFSLFQRFKRSKIAQVREQDAGGCSPETIHALIMATPGLEDYSSEAVGQLTPDDVKDLRRIKIRSALLRSRVSPKYASASAGGNNGLGFMETNKLMSASWKAIDDFGSSVFEEMAEEGRSDAAQATARTASPSGWEASRTLPPKSLPTKLITPQLSGDDAAAQRDAKMAHSPASAKRTEEPEPVSEDDGHNLVQEVTFPRQLMDVIEHQSTKGGAVTVSGERVLEWLPSGDAFIIRDKVVLEKEVLPRHFSAKCKFMSFVRKLYRWGFRQLEKDSRGILIFSHSNFVRGDKKRCLKMRSIVKKPSAREQQGFSASGGIMTGGVLSPPNDMHALRAFGASNSPSSTGQYYRMGPSGGGGCMREFQRPVAGDRWAPLPPSRQFYPYRGEGGGMMNPSDGMGYCGSPPSRRMGGMTSTEMFEAALRLERLEERERKQRKMEMLQSRDVYSTSSSINLPPPAMGRKKGSGGNPVLGRMSDVELAYEMMKQDSQMRAYQALEMAKRMN